MVTGRRYQADRHGLTDHKERQQVACSAEQRKNVKKTYSPSSGMSVGRYVRKEKN